MTEQVASTLRTMPFLETFPEDLFDRLAPLARPVDFPRGTVVFRQGEETKTIYLMLEGSVALEICAPAVGCKRILTVGPGELLGWSPILKQHRMTATARALADSRALAFDADQLIVLCESEPRFGYEFMKRAALALAKRLHSTRQQLVDVYGAQMPPAPEEP